MKEKKLTDEEIVKALENEIEGKIWLSKGNIAPIKNALDLIRRLQSENERLTEDNKRLNELLVGGTEVIDYWNNKYLEERAKNAELQQQVDELKKELEEKNTYEEKQNSLIDNLKDDITELEKQVNELKQENSVLSITVELQEEVEKQLVKDTAKEIFAELFYIASIHHSDVANILAWAKAKAKQKGVEVE